MKLIEFINKYLNQHDFCPDYLATGENGNKVIVKYVRKNVQEVERLSDKLEDRNSNVWKNTNYFMTYEEHFNKDSFALETVFVFTFNRV
tara:strand:+ start:689 stop:955 length:267 start_codon:yes stop_codon:yes gene_type:complete